MTHLARKVLSGVSPNTLMRSLAAFRLAAPTDSAQRDKMSVSSPQSMLQAFRISMLDIHTDNLHPTCHKPTIRVRLLMMLPKLRGVGGHTCSL